MENYKEIEEKVNTTYKKLIVFSVIVLGVSLHFKQSLLNTSNFSRHPFGFMLLGMMVVNIMFLVIWNIGLIIICKYFEIGSTIFPIITNIISYIGTLVFFIAKGLHPSNIFLIILGVLITVIMFVIGLVFGWFGYYQVCILQDLKVKSKYVAEVYFSHQRNVDIYNEKIREYNKMNQRIHEIGKAVSEKYDYKDIQYMNENSMPKYDADNIHMFNCEGALDYLNRIEKYQKNNTKIQRKMQNQEDYIDSTIKKKEGLLNEAERNINRINVGNTSRLNEFFRDSTRPAFHSLKEKKKYEKKIKSLKGR